MDMFSQQASVSTHAKAVTALKYSPCQDLLVSASADQTCRLYRSTDCTLISTLGGGTSTHNHGTGITATSTGEGASAGGKQAARQEREAWHTEGLNDVAWLHNCNSSTLATASDDKLIKIWDVETGAVVSTLSGHASFVFSLTAHPTQSYLVSGSEDETLRLWDLRCAGYQVHALEAHEEPVSCVAFHPTGDHVVSSSYDGLARVWDFRTLACRRTLALSALDGGEPAAPVPIGHMQYTPNGSYLLASCLDNSLRLLRPFHTHLYAPPPSRAAERDFYTANVSEQDAYTTNVHKRIKRTCPVRAVEVVKTFTGHVAKKYSCPAAFLDASSSSWAACEGSSGSGEGQRSNWGGKDEASAERQEGDGAERRRRERRDLINGSTLVLSGSEDHSVCVWDLQSEQHVGRLRGHCGPVLALDVSDRHGQVVSGGGSGDCSVRVWRSEKMGEGGEPTRAEQT